MNFGEYLRQCRKKLDWSQPQAASNLEIEQSYLSKLENGKSYPSEKIFDKLTEIYRLNMDELNDKLPPEDLNKLKEIKQFRQRFLNKESAKIKATRSWLIGGLVMIILGACFLGLALTSHQAQVEHTYRSEGILKEGEELDVFALVYEEGQIPSEDPSLVTKRQELIARLDQIHEVTQQYKGEGFVVNTAQGRRFFKLLNSKEVNSSETTRFFIPPAFLFLLGGIACFYISRRW